MQLWIEKRIMESRPVMLVRRESMLRPHQQVLCLLVINNKLHKLSAKYAISTATNNLNFMWCWWVFRTGYPHSCCAICNPFFMSLYQIKCVSINQINENPGADRLSDNLLLYIAQGGKINQQFACVYKTK